MLDTNKNYNRCETKSGGLLCGRRGTHSPSAVCLPSIDSKLPEKSVTRCGPKK